jgi:hypothetical protein
MGASLYREASIETRYSQGLTCRSGIDAGSIHCILSAVVSHMIARCYLPIFAAPARRFSKQEKALDWKQSWQGICRPVGSVGRVKRQPWSASPAADSQS